MSFLKSVEQFLYEVVSWIVFYPITMWRALRHPIAMVRYSSSELDDAHDNQFTETISPPLFLFITLVLTRAMGLGFLGSAMDKQAIEELSTAGSSDTNVLVLTALVFAVFPLAMSVALLRAKRIPLDHQPLKKPFYAQCYVAAPFAFAMSAASSLSDSASSTGQWLGVLLICLALGWYTMTEVRIFHAELHITWLSATFHVLRALMLAVLVILMAVAVVFIRGLQHLNA